VFWAGRAVAAASPLKQNRGSRLAPTLRLPFLPPQVQQLQQVPVPHVYSSQVQYVEGGDASYAASAM
jgi:regulatory factor X 1/2/3